MTIGDLQTYQDLKAFLRNWNNADGELVPYDFNGLLHLLLAAVDNLAKNHIEADLDNYAGSITEAQATFLSKLLEMRKSGGR